MKKLHHSVMSTQKCTMCDKPLKQNLVNKPSNKNLCYKCYRISIGKPAHHVPRRKRIEAGLPVHNSHQVAEV